MKAPFVQPEKSRVANVTIAKSRVLATQFLRILSDTRKERPSLLGVNERHFPSMRLRRLNKREPCLGQSADFLIGSAISLRSMPRFREADLPLITKDKLGVTVFQIGEIGCAKEEF